MDRADELYKLVAEIPAGRVISYSALGLAMIPRMWPRQVGNYMRFSSPGIPWWRVVAADGHISLAKSDPAMAVEQRKRLESEGVEFKGECVRMADFLWDANEAYEAGLI
ncbi:MAG: MGMT family protein [Fimbriimonas sp.]